MPSDLSAIASATAEAWRMRAFRQICTPYQRPFTNTKGTSSLSGFALHAAKQTADAVWLENEYYKETSER